MKTPGIENSAIDSEKSSSKSQKQVHPDTNVACQIFQKYLAGNFGYGHAKTELLNLILTRFEKARELFNYYMNNLPELEEKLQIGAEKTRKIAAQTLKRVRASVGM